MIVVFGPNLAVDRTLGVPGFQAGRVFRTGHTLTVPGGKGVNVARALKALGGEPHLVGLVAGWTGRFIREGLEQEGIPATLVEVGGLSRTCTIIVDPRSGDATVINEEGDLDVTPEHLAALQSALSALVAQAQVVVCSGSLPQDLAPDSYARVIAQSREAGVPSILDTSGEALRLGVRARPSLIKPNRSELLQLARSDQADLEVAADPGFGSGEVMLAEAARHVMSTGPEAAIVSLGAAGAIGVTPEAAWVARSPKVQVVDPIGAGDSMVAALSWGLARGLPLPELVALGVASGTADVTTFGGGLISRQAVEDLLARVSVAPLAL
ncbi:MAG: 1-phosphofructokinase family hexose kinase [Bacillota bacterium]